MNAHRTFVAVTAGVAGMLGAGLGMYARSVVSADPPEAPPTAGLLLAVEQLCDSITFTAGALPIDLAYTVDDNNPMTPPTYPVLATLAAGETLRVPSADTSRAMSWRTTATTVDGFQSSTGGTQEACT